MNIRGCERDCPSSACVCVPAEALRQECPTAVPPSLRNTRSCCLPCCACSSHWEAPLTTSFYLQCVPHKDLVTVKRIQMCPVLREIYIFKYYEKHHITTSQAGNTARGRRSSTELVEFTLGLYMLFFISGEVITQCVSSG